MTTPQRSSLAAGIVGWRQGRGPAMLLIHGVGMRAEFWGNIEDTLAQSFSLTVIDMPGHGESPTLDDCDPALSRYTDSIAAVLAEEGSPCIVVGHSMGALIALDLAVRYPARVAGIGVLNGVYRRTVEALAAINARVAELSSMQRADPSSTLERWFGKAPQGVNVESARACRDWLGSADLQGYRDAYRAFANADAPPVDQLQKINCPALFMTGSLEPNSTPAMSEHMAELVPDATCLVVSGAKHMMSMTHGEQVVDALTDRFSSRGNQ